MPYFHATDGTKLYYEESGEGIPVLALSGLTRNTRDFDHVAPHLPVRFIRMDYRGRGQSDWADHSTYNIPQEATDALALLDHLELKQAAVLGTSRGGLIAMLLAATAKDRLLGVVLNDIGPEIDPKGMKVIAMPHADRIIAPIVYTVPSQLLAYHVAVLRGTDVDQPRNLAKSVTVE